MRKTRKIIRCYYFAYDGVALKGDESVNIQYLREFLVFQSHMNYTAAAKELYISQPALSSHISALEKELDVELVSHGRMPALTQAGRTLVEEASHLINLHDDIVEKCRYANQNGGTITIARNHGTRSCNEDNFDILLSGFAAAHPEVFIRDIAWDDECCYDYLAAGEADCISANFMPAPDDMERGVTFVQAPNYVNGKFCLWVDESHPLAQCKHLSWDEIDSLKMVFSTCQRLTSMNTRCLCEAQGVSLQSRLTPEFGWSYMRALRPDEVLMLDTGFIGYESLKMFPTRRLVPIVGPQSDCVLHIAYLKSNENKSVKAFIDYIESQRVDPSYVRE